MHQASAANMAEQAVERTIRLQAVTAGLWSALTPSQVADVILCEGVAAVAADAGSIWALADQGRVLELLGYVGYPREREADVARIPVERPGPLSAAIESRELVIVETPGEMVARWPHGAEPSAAVGDAATVAAPLLREKSVLGVLYLAFRRPVRFNAEDRALITTLARQCSLALERSRLYEAEREARAEAEAAREQARVAEARYRSLFENSVDPILVTDARGRVLAANAALIELLGYSLDELQLLSQRSGIVALAVDQGFGRAQLIRVMKDGRWLGEIELRCKDGSIVPVEAHVQVVELPAGTVYMASWRDISERRRLDTMQQEFLSMAAHELRNPLAALRGYAQVLQRGRTYNDRAIEAIIRQTERLERLTGDLLDASRLATGRLELKLGPTDLVELVRDCAENAQASTSRHALQVAAPDAPLEGLWDRDRLAQAIENLLTNAVRYTPEGGDVMLEVEDLGQQARLSIKDRGIGIPPEALPHLFDRFYRVHAAGTSGVDGLGLGLHVARALVEAQGGRIGVDSVLGEGSTFTIVLPYQPVANAPLRSSDTESSSA